MIQTATRLAASLLIPAILLVCIIAGGSSQPEQVSYLSMQFGAAVVCLAGLYWASSRSPGIPPKILFALCGLFVAWGYLQTLPLPNVAWKALPDREVISEGRTILGLNSDTTYPISFLGHETRTALLGFLPPAAIAIAMLALGRRRISGALYWAIPIIGAASVGLGIAQIISGNWDSLYWHDIGSRGYMAGFFANVNHQASLCLMALPFTAALGARLARKWEYDDENMGLAVLIAGLFITNLVGVLGAGSFAAYIILAPVLFLSFALYSKGFKTDGEKRGPIIAIMFALVLGVIGLVSSSPILEGLGVTSFEENDLSRLGIWRVSGEIASDHLLVGTGGGTFTEVYRLYEAPAEFTTRFINYAHNDYLQTVFEYGLPGVILMGAMLAVWLFAFFKVWTTREGEDYKFRRAASISVLVPVLHSIVDYPLRTPAIACLATACLILMLLPSRGQNRSKKALGEERRGHVTI